LPEIVEKEMHTYIQTRHGGPNNMQQGLLTQIVANLSKFPNVYNNDTLKIDLKSLKQAIIVSNTKIKDILREGEKHGIEVNTIGFLMKRYLIRFEYITCFSYVVIFTFSLTIL
jgi:hypothetical protein